MLLLHLRFLRISNWRWPIATGPLAPLSLMTQ
jgi:hypothetical protein